jgi:flap endonuclease GEN
MTECKMFLDALGVESIKSTGEAEALCAQLNAEGLVDAVISEDSDAICYGAQVVLRNFSIASSANGARVERYSIGKIERTVLLLGGRNLRMVWDRVTMCRAAHIA